MNQEPRPSGEFSDELRALGENLRTVFQAAWDSDDRRRLQREIETGMGELADSLSKAAREFSESDTGKQMKDEVRDLGLALGLPREWVFRHPFPGPGLGVRILGEVKREYADLLRRADAIFIEELRSAGWYDQVAQAFTVFLPVRSVGVMGDGRTYEHVVALRAVQTSDFMTARWAPLPHDLLARVSNRIINEVRGINRVVYDVSGKPPATIEWE